MGIDSVAKVAGSAILSAAMNTKPAVFLDRDGTIIEQVRVLNDPAQVRLIPGVGDAIKKLNEKGYLVVVLTNQPAIEKKEMTEEQLAVVHAELTRQLQDSFGARLDDIETCPHRYHPPGDAILPCACRKPGTKLIEDAEAKFTAQGIAIDRNRSWLIGDRLRDIETGKRVGIRTIQVLTGTPDPTDDGLFPNTKPNIITKDLNAAIDFIQ